MKNLLLIICCLLFSSCADQSKNMDAGFWVGFAHGLLIYVAWLFMIFSDYQIYSVINVGFGYDLGFMLGIALINIVYFQQKQQAAIDEALQKYIIKPRKNKK